MHTDSHTKTTTTVETLVTQTKDKFNELAILNNKNILFLNNQHQSHVETSSAVMSKHQTNTNNLIIKINEAITYRKY